MLETYRGIPHLLDTWIVLTGMAVPIAISSVHAAGRRGPQARFVVDARGRRADSCGDAQSDR